MKVKQMNTYELFLSRKLKMSYDRIVEQSIDSVTESTYKYMLLNGIDGGKSDI